MSVDSRPLARQATIAAESILEKHGAELLEVSGAAKDSLRGISFKGWTFRSKHELCMSSDAVGALARRISVLCGTPSGSIAADEDSIRVGDTPLHVPPMLFGDDALEVIIQ